MDLAAQVSANVFYQYLCNSMYIQVLSESVANGLRSTGGDKVVETIKFVDYFDKYFDCVNVSSLSPGKHQWKPFKQGYYSKDGFRLKVAMHSLSHDNYQLLLHSG